MREESTKMTATEERLLHEWLVQTGRAEAVKQEAPDFAAEIGWHLREALDAGPRRPAADHVAKQERRAAERTPEPEQEVVV